MKSPDLASVAEEDLAAELKERSQRNRKLRCSGQVSASASMPGGPPCQELEPPAGNEDPQKEPGG